LSRLIAQDVAAGRSVFVCEPKSDLVAEVLHHIPVERIDDVAVIDPTDAVAPVGLNPLAGAAHNDAAEAFGVPARPIPNRRYRARDAKRGG